MQFKEIRIARPTTIRSVRRIHKVSSSEIQEFNPDLSRWFIRRGGTLPRGYRLKVPVRYQKEEASAISVTSRVRGLLVSRAVAMT